MQDIKVGERTLAALRGEIIDKEAGVKEILSKPVRWLFKAVGAKEIPATAGKGMPNVLGKSPSKKPKFSLAHATNNTSGIGSTERLNMLGRDELKFPVEKPKLVPAGESNAKASAGPKKAKEPNTLKDTTATTKGDTKPDTSPVRWLSKAVGAKEVPAIAGKGMPKARVDMLPNAVGKSSSKKPRFGLAHATNNTSGLGSAERLNMLGRDELKFPVEKPKLVPAGESNAKASAGPKKAKEPNTLKDTTATAKGDTKPDTSVPDESPEWMKKFKTGKTYKSMQDNPLAWTGGALAAGGIGAKVLFPGHKNEQA